MKLTKMQQMTLIQGIIEIPEISHTNLELIHKLAPCLDIDDFEIKKISIYEDPVIAIIEMESKAVIHRQPFKTLLSKHARIRNVCQNFQVFLKLTQFTRSTKRVELSYCIKILESEKNLQNDALAMVAARGIKERLILNFQKATTNLNVIPFSRV